MKAENLEKEIYKIVKDYMKEHMKAIKIGDLLDMLLKVKGIKRFEDEGSKFKNEFSKTLDGMIEKEIVKESPKGYIINVPGGEKLIKESRTFSEHLKFLVEGKLNEATNDSNSFSQEVYDFLSNEPMYVLNKNHTEAELELDEFPKIGKLLVKVYSEGKDKIDFYLELIAKDKEIVTLAKSPLIDTSKQDYKKYSKKFVKYAAKVASDLSLLHDNLNIV